MMTATRDTLIPPANRAGDHRSALRKSVRLDARVRDKGATRFSIRVVDLSPTGFRAETAFTLKPGATIWITLPGLQSLEATVAWQRGEQVGAAFRQPLYGAVFEHIVELGR